MKFKHLAVLGLLAALAAGCSKDTPVPDPDAWKYDESLPVPIQFGAPRFGVATKADIPSIGDMVGRPVGVFAWGEGSSVPMSSSAKSIFENNYLRAQVVSSGGGYSLKFVEQGQSVASAVPVYYPMSSNYNYTFYAYHTGNESLSGAYEADNDSYYVNVGFDTPFNDVLWGKFSDDSLHYDDATLPHLKYKGTVIKGFNSRFSRAAVAAYHEVGTPESDYYPAIEFKHVCSAFRFYAKIDTAMTQAQRDTLLAKLTITSVSIDNVPVNTRLIVASRDPMREGTFNTVVKGTAALSLPDLKPEDSANGRLLEADGESRFFLPPGNYEDATASLALVVGGKHYTLDFPLKFGESTWFNPGKCYSFIVIFKSLEEINMKVSLAAWDEDNFTTVDTDYKEQ